MIFKSRERQAIEAAAMRIKQKNYQGDPKDWLVNRFGMDDKMLEWSKYPGYENHKWDGTPNPFLTATNALAARKWVGIEAATSVGKTYFLPYVIYWFLDTYPNSLVITTAPKRDQLRRVLWSEMANAYPKFRRIRPYSEFLTLNVRVDKNAIKTLNTTEKNGIVNIEGNPGHEAIGFVSGVGAGEESATKFQGFHRENMLFVIDETAGVHTAVITAIINTCTDTNNLVIAVGNPDSQVDALHTFCNLTKVEHIIISALDHPNIVVPSDKTLIPGAVTQQSIDFRKSEYGEESPFYKSRIRGIAPEEGTGSLIKGAWFDQCTMGHESFLKQEHIGYEGAVGVDPSNSDNGDAAALAWGRGNMLQELHEFNCPNAAHLAYNLIYPESELARKGYRHFGTSLLETYAIEDNKIGVDGVGVGISTVNAFYDEGIKCISLMGGAGQLDYSIRTGTNGEDLYKFANLRSQMYWEAREDLDKFEVIINISNPKLLKQLKKELLVHKYQVKAGKVAVESKAEITKRLGKSPNVADAFVYWNWIRKNYYNQNAHVPFSSGNYNPE